MQHHLDLVSLPLQPCKGNFTRSIGLPCAHIWDVKKENGGLTPSDFHEHWYWDRKSTLQPLLNPLCAGRQRAANINIQVARTAVFSQGGKNKQSDNLYVQHAIGKAIQ